MEDEQKMTDEEVNKVLAERGMTEQMIEAKMTKILDAISQAKIMKQLEQTAKELGFDSGDNFRSKKKKE